MANYLWLIPLLPLVGAIVNGIGAIQKTTSRALVNVIACGVVFISFLVSCVAFFELRALSGGHETIPQLVSGSYTWIQAGDFSVQAGLIVDPLSAVMILVVTGIGFLIHLYSTAYMDHEPAFARYFAYLNLFMFSMLTLVMGENMVVMFVGWEGVGVCSYLLIGFWYRELPNAIAGKKAFVVNRIGDFGFLLGMFLLYWSLQRAGIPASLSFVDLREALASASLPGSLVTIICLLLFLGATGKSAQLPLYVWLPDAMAGPTPVSALIHAATMVTAGIYMIVRLNFLFILSPVAMTTIAVIGAVTAIFAATIGLTQTDIKKVLAYSTVSQLGYMFLAAGLGAFSAAIFHLVTHAFFKACLFLGSGSVIHAMGGEQDIRQMGGLRHKLPYTHATFFVSTVAIAGIFPTAGFMSKDEILARALSADTSVTLVPGIVLWGIGVIAALTTTFYMFRLVFLTFYGHFRGDEHTEHHVHESPMAMVIPLVILSGLALVGGVLNVPHLLGGTEMLHHWLAPLVTQEPQWHHVDTTWEYGLMVVLHLLIFSVISMVVHLYLWKPEILNRLTERNFIYRLSLHKYYVDELYEALLVRPIHAVSRHFLWPVMDAGLIDGIVNGAAAIVRGMGSGFGRLTTGFIGSYAFSIVAGTLLILSYLALRG